MPIILKLIKKISDQIYKICNSWSFHPSEIYLTLVQIVQKPAHTLGFGYYCSVVCWTSILLHPSNMSQSALSIFHMETIQITERVGQFFCNRLDSKYFSLRGRIHYFLSFFLFLVYNLWKNHITFLSSQGVWGGWGELHLLWLPWRRDERLDGRVTCTQGHLYPVYPVYPDLGVITGAPRARVRWAGLQTARGGA